MKLKLVSWPYLAYLKKIRSSIFSEFVENIHNFVLCSQFWAVKHVFGTFSQIQLVFGNFLSHFHKNLKMAVLSFWRVQKGQLGRGGFFKLNDKLGIFFKSFQYPFFLFKNHQQIIKLAFFKNLQYFWDLIFSTFWGWFCLKTHY